MVRSLLGVVVALITAFAVFSIFIMIASMFAPQPPKNFEYRNEVEIVQFMLKTRATPSFVRRGAIHSW